MQHKPKNIIELWGAYDCILEIWAHADAEDRGEPRSEEDNEHLIGQVRHLGQILGHGDYIASMVAYIIRLSEKDTDPLVALGKLWVQAEEAKERRAEMKRLGYGWNEDHPDA